MTAVMLYGGRSDGEILDVPSDVLGQGFMILYRPINFSDMGKSYTIEERQVKVSIVPRRSIQGPLWKADLPKELW
jgi:hypothetical protein